MIPMSSTAQRLCKLHLQKALNAYLVGDNVRGNHHMDCARTFASPIGNLIAQTYN